MATAAPAPRPDCDECGFRWADWSRDDLVTTSAAAGPLLAAALDRCPDDLADSRPTQAVWSPLEYVDHVRFALWVWRFAAEAALGEPGVDLRSEGLQERPGPHRRFADPDAVVAAAGDEGTALAATLSGLDDGGWVATALIERGVADLDWMARHAVHELLHHGHDIGRVRRALGDGIASTTGSVERINVSDGGVPKRPVDAAAISPTGLSGDRQADRRHHGRPFQAVCLWSADVIDALRDEGHPIEAGDAGENLTIAGIPWSDLRAGAILAVGDEARLELSAPAVPCTKNGRWFADGDSRRIDHARHPGWSRWYATVLRPGVVRPGDVVVVEP